ncbi:hypothetical protein PR002_g14710 [Phytophthora rubi]|uniref:Uncharacterized protein n=1 Tax=Phytophthora rubi TaxID=129364 RepID=A0A6A3KZM4_9STRA|nr:hypothetical protein PR002_g14710 [Phytophthora rubi]
METDDEDWGVPVNEEEAEASLTFDYNEETIVNNYDVVEMWHREDNASAGRYEDELTTMETTANWERPATVGYATTTEESQPSERASGVLTTEEVAFDLEEPCLRTEEPSERAIGALTAEEVAHDLEDDYLRMEKPSESATGELTTELDEETTRKTTVNVCNGARCRCIEALPVVKERVNFLPAENAKDETSVAPAEKETDGEESDSPATAIGVPLPKPTEYDRDADPSVLERASVASEEGQKDVESTKESGETPDESAASKEAAPPPEEPPPPHARLFTEAELRALETSTPSTVGVELED